MRVVPVLFLLSLAVCAYSESCPSNEEIHPCYCENMADTGNILVTCYDDPDDNDDFTVDELKSVLKVLVGKKNVEIELDGMDLGNMPSNLFEGIQVIRLEIAHCELDSLTDKEDQPGLAGLEDSLEELIIMSSLMEDDDVNKMKLDHLRNLREFDLSYNGIAEVTDDWFDKGPISLEYLNLENNGIEELGSRAFANLANLRTLSLVGNRFGPLKRSMLPSSADNLNTLEFDNNALTSIPEDIFSNMPELSIVSLRTNGIARLEEVTWDGILEQLDVLYLEGNPLECNSHMSWLFNIRVTSAIYGTCFAPKDKEGTSLQDFIDSKGQ